jgi:cytosine/adenosine deaminase-related metal-dependent hydrolase
MTTPTTVRPAPGCINAHTHIYSGLAPLGMPPPAIKPANFVEILERVWWRLDRALDERSLRASARLYVGEALLHGTTTLVDHHESPCFIEHSLDVLADTCQELGMRAVLCFGATERNGGEKEAERGLAECRRFILGNTRSLVRGVVGLHASFTVSDDAAREAGRLARELQTVVHVHMAEDVADVADAKRRGHRGPLERLLALDALPRGSIMAHGVHLDEAEVREAASRGLWLVQNPRSNEGNEVGYPGALRASPRVALGTDGYPSDLGDELAALRRLAAAHPAAEPDGAECASRRLDAGRTMVSERFRVSVADLARDEVTLDPDPARPGRHADRVRIAGRLVVERGRLAWADIDEIRAHAREEAPRLWARMQAL